MEEANKLKRTEYKDLSRPCSTNGWRTWVLPVEVWFPSHSEWRSLSNQHNRTQAGNPGWKLPKGRPRTHHSKSDGRPTYRRRAEWLINLPVPPSRGCTECRRDEHLIADGMSPVDVYDMQFGAVLLHSDLSWPIRSALNCTYCSRR